MERLKLQRKTNSDHEQQNTFHSSLTENSLGAQDPTLQTPIPEFAHNFADIRIFSPEYTVQRKATRGQTPEATGFDLSTRIQARSGGGSPLEQNVQTQLETGIGADLSNVRVHDDSEANKLSHELHANAFTTGNDVFFRQGLYNPNSSDGMRLLAHEATHTVQQANGAVDGVSWGGGVKVSDPNDRFEQAAEATANNVMNSSAVGFASTGGSSGEGFVQREAVPEEEEHKLETLKPEEEKELQMRRDSSNTLVVQRDPISNTKPQGTKPSVDDRLSQIGKDQVALKKRLDAGELDDAIRGRLLRKLSDSSQAVLRLTQSFQRGKTAFESTQAEQARTDAVTNQIIAMVATTALAWAFEPTAGLLGKWVNISEKKIEAFENIFNAAVSGEANVLNQAAQNNAAVKGAAPEVKSSSLGNDPLVFLTANLETVGGFGSQIESAFAKRKAGYAKASTDEWDKYDPVKHATSYAPILEGIEKLVQIQKLKHASEMATIIEKHLWAAWLLSNGTPVVKEYGSSKGKALKDRSAEDFDSIGGMSLGSDIEVKLNALGISATAGVKLSGHFYSSNSPSNWRALLYVWAQNYAEKIG